MESETPLIRPNLARLSEDKPSKRAHVHISHSLPGKRKRKKKRQTYARVLDVASEVYRNDFLRSCKVNMPDVLRSVCAIPSKEKMLFGVELQSSEVLYITTNTKKYHINFYFFLLLLRANLYLQTFIHGNK